VPLLTLCILWTKGKFNEFLFEEKIPQSKDEEEDYKKLRSF
jgi:hypothetical protein